MAKKRARKTTRKGKGPGCLKAGVTGWKCRPIKCRIKSVGTHRRGVHYCPRKKSRKGKK
jgi:hypothetical protein